MARNGKGRQRRGQRAPRGREEDDVTHMLPAPLAAWVAWAWQCLLSLWEALLGLAVPQHQQQRQAPLDNPRDDASSTASTTTAATLSPQKASSAAGPGGVPGRLPFCYKAVKCGSLAHLMRHGEREDHVNPGWVPGVSSGSSGTAAGCALSADDPPLSKNGLLQARETATYFKEMDPKTRPTAVVCSPFIRTLQTGAEIASKLQIPLVVEPGISEYICKRSYKGQPKMGCFGRAGAPGRVAGQWLEEAYVPVAPAVPAFPEKEGGAGERFRSVVAQIVDANPNSSIVFVTHRFGVQQIIDGYLSRMRSGGVSQVNYCSVTTLERRPPTRSTPEKSWKYHTLSYIEHLSNSSSLYFKR